MPLNTEILKFLTMKKNKLNQHFISILLIVLVGAFFPTSQARAQKRILIDGVVGIVGQKSILKSEIENTLLQYKARQMALPGNDRCYIFEELLFQTLLLNQADLDSVYASDGQVESQLNRRLDYFEEQMGGRKAMEEYFGKPYKDMKEFFRETVEDQIVIQQMQSQITSDIVVSPAEVSEFYAKIPKDSLPIVQSEIQFSQIVIYPEIKAEQEEKIKEELLNIKERVENGSMEFTVAAILYSDDRAANEKNGSLGWVRRGDLVPEFSEAAFSLSKPGELSDIVQTDFGYHLIKFHERRGEQVLVSHILMKPKVKTAAKLKAKNKLDSIAKLIRTDKYTFEEAAEKFTEDDAGKRNGGTVINPYSGTSTFKSEDIDPSTNFIIRKLDIGEISEPFESTNMKGKTEMKIISVKSKTKPHVATLETDYQRISDMALEKKKQQAVDDWIKEKQKTTYIKISPEYQSCDFKYEGWLKAQ